MLCGGCRRHPGLSWRLPGPADLRAFLPQLGHCRRLAPNRCWGRPGAVCLGVFLSLGQCREAEEFVSPCFLKGGCLRGWCSEIYGHCRLGTNSLATSGFVCGPPASMCLLGTCQKCRFLSRRPKPGEECLSDLRAGRPLRSEGFAPTVSTGCSDSFCVNLRGFVLVYFGTSVIRSQSY